MTKEEAIDIIKCLAWHTRPDEEDIEQAINVLKQEHCEELDFIQPHKKIVVNLEVCNMRNATQIEREGIEQYIEGIAEHCEDCVSRQAVLEQTYNWSKDEFLRVTNPFDYLRKKINSLPPVTPEEKVGRWILVQRGKYVDVNCSECGFSRIKEFAYNYTVEDISEQEFRDFVEKNKMNLCECCGAKIQEVTDEADN